MSGWTKEAREKLSRSMKASHVKRKREAKEKMKVLERRAKAKTNGEHLPASFEAPVLEVMEDLRKIDAKHSVDKLAALIVAVWKQL